MDYDYDGDGDARIDEAMAFLRWCNDAESNNRREALDDLRFSYGDQWPIELQNSRNLESRPCLTINKIDSYVRQITNNQRQQRPRIKVHPTNTQADKKVAEIVEGIIRHIEQNSNADVAYDTAFDHAVRIGWGYVRIVTDYVREDSFDQELFIKPVENPFTVYFDPNSQSADGSDAERVLITTVMSKAAFREQFPNANDGANFVGRGTGDETAEWVTKHDIRVAESFYVDRVKDTLWLLSDGSSAFESEANAEELFAAGIVPIEKRPSYRRVIKWCKLTAMEVLEERELQGRYIPVVPVYGIRTIIEDKVKKFGVVRFAKDPQRMYNFWRTSMTESVALAPKAKWLLAEGQDEGHEYEWTQANIKSTPVLRYKQTDIEGRPAPQPTRLQPEPPPAGILTAAETVSQDLQAVLGIFDPNQMPTGNISGKALNGQQQQIDLSNYHFYDNLTRMIRHVGKILLDLIPFVYSEERVMRIIGADGQPDLVNINQRQADAYGVEKVLNDVTVGEYDVVMDTGPGYASKRIQAIEAMMPLMSGNPELFNVAGDLVFRNMDFPGAEVIADRLAAANPMAQIDDKSPVPPQVQMQLAQNQAQMQQMAQQIQALQMTIKQRQDIEQVRQDSETKRELLRQTAKAHNTETMAEVKVNDQNTRAITSQNKTEIDAIVQLLLHHMDTNRLMQEIERRNAEQFAFAQSAVTDVSSGASPFIQQ